MTRVGCVVPIVKFKTAMLMSSLCDKIDAYVLMKRTKSVTNTATTSAAASNNDKK